MSLRDAAKLTGISQGTLSRIEREVGSPAAETLAVLANWLNIPLTRLMWAGEEFETNVVVYNPRESLPEIVAAHLRNDKNLSTDAAKRLTEVFRTAYEQFRGFEKK